MAAGPKDAGQTQDNIQEAPARPNKAPRSVAWPEGANMAAQQSAANQMFRQNSERLQRASEAKCAAQFEQTPASGPRELSFAKDHARGNYAELNQEHANAILKGEHSNAVGKNVPDNQKQKQEQNKSTNDRDLRFVKNDARDTNPEPKQEQAGRSGKDLNFVKDQSQDLDRGR